MALRVGFLTPHARATDGWGRYTVELLTELRGLGVEPVLFTAERDADGVLQNVEHHPVLPPLFVRRFELARTLRVAPRLRRLSATCDVLHVLAEPYLPLAALAVRRHQALVMTAHGTWAVRPLATTRRPFWIAPLRRVDLLVCQSRFTRNAMMRHVTLPRSVVLPAGVRVEHFDRRFACERPAWLPPGPVVLSVSALKARKGVHVAIEAIAMARRRHPNLQFVIAGPAHRDSRYWQSIDARLGELGLREAVHVIGPTSVDDLAAWYHRADIFMLLPVADHGAFEGLGLVYLEAGAAGVPSIGTRDCGAEDAIADGDTGVLVPPGDAPAAAAALDDLLANPERRLRLGAAARAYAQTVSWARLAGRLAGEYPALVAERQGRP